MATHALLLLVLIAAPDKVFAGEADSTQEQEDVLCEPGKNICADTGKCQKTCKNNDDEEPGLKRRRREANLGSVSDSSHYTASTAATANSIWPSLTECVMVSTESSENTVSYQTMTTDSSGFSPSSDVSIRCTMAPTESYPSTSATSTDFMSASSASMPASYSSMPSSSASMTPSYSSMPPSSASMPSSSASMPSSYSSMPPSSASMPLSSASMPPSYSSMPTNSASMPPSSASMPPNSPSMSTSYSTMPPTSASMPSIYSSTTPSSSSMPPSVASMPPSFSSMPPSSVSMPANTASISPSPASTAASAGSVSANTVSTMESASSVIVTTTQTVKAETKKEMQFKVEGSLSDFLGNNSVEIVAKHMTTQIADQLNVNTSRIRNVKFIEQTASRRKRAVSQSSSVIVSFEIIPATSSSQQTIAALESMLKNAIFGGNFTLIDISGNPLTVDITFFSSVTVSADEAPEKRRDIVPIIVGTVVGVFCLALIFIIIVVVILKTKKRNKHNSLVSPTPSPSSSGGKLTRSPYDDSKAGPLPEKNSNDIRNQSSVVENETAPGTSTRPGSESQTQDRN